MGTSYDFSIKDTEDAMPVDAGIDGWDAVIQINNVVNRRYAAQTPLSLISRQIDFRGNYERGTLDGDVGFTLTGSTVFPLIDMGGIGSSSNVKNLIIIPTMIGLMVHPETTGTMNTGFTGFIGVRNNGTASTPYALTSAFSLAPQTAALNSTAIGSSSVMPNIAATSPSANNVAQPTATSGAGLGASAGTVALNVPAASNPPKGYYYLCPVNRHWLGHQLGAAGGAPLRGFTALNSVSGNTAFIPDANDPSYVADADVVYASSVSGLNEIVLVGVGTNTARFSIIDLYGMVIPTTG